MQVASARDYVSAGTTALMDAKQSKKKSRKLQCCICVTVLIIFFIIVCAIAIPLGIQYG